MAIKLKEISKTIELKLDKVPKSKRAKVRKEVGEFVVDSILDSVGGGKSPVKGEGSFERLSKKYADSEKGGSRLPNLDLEGDMLDAVDWKKVRGKDKEDIKVGIFDIKEVPKADGHNNFSGKSKLPRRRFIPRASGKFVDKIEKGIKQIIKENESTEVVTTPTQRRAASARQDEAIEEFLDEASLERLDVGFGVEELIEGFNLDKFLDEVLNGR